MDYERYRGTVKFFRGSFGWLTSNDIAKKIGDRDIFLHKNQLNSVLQQQVKRVKGITIKLINQ